MKVYCKDCKHLIGTLYCKEYLHYLGKTLVRANKEDVVVQIINKNHDCPVYKRKWWKFWAGR